MHGNFFVATVVNMQNGPPCFKNIKGCFIGIFCSLLSVTETCKRQATNLIFALRSLFAHYPLFS